MVVGTSTTPHRNHDAATAASTSAASPAAAASGRAWAMSAVAGEPIIRLENVSRVYDTGKVQVPALLDVDLEVADGEFLAIVGPSGSGKSTMMNILGCLDRPTSGRYVLDGQPVDELDDDGLAFVRSRSIGFVFQSYNLLPRTSALENVAAPLMYQGIARKERLQRAQAVLGAARPGRPPRSRALRALGRAAAAGRHRQGAGDRAGPDPGRRTHRQPRQPLRRRGSRAVQGSPLRLGEPSS